MLQQDEAILQRFLSHCQEVLVKRLRRARAISGYVIMDSILNVFGVNWTWDVAAFFKKDNTLPKGREGGMNTRTWRNKSDFSIFRLAQHFVVIRKPKLKEKKKTKNCCLLNTVTVVEQILDFDASKVSNVSVQTFCPKWILHWLLRL